MTPPKAKRTKNRKKRNVTPPTPRTANGIPVWSRANWVAQNVTTINRPDPLTELAGLTVLSVDPSITCTGWSLFRGPDELVAFGKIKPDGRQFEHWSTIDQTASIIRQLADVITGTIPMHCYPRMSLVEVTIGKTSSRHQGAGSGLATYGFVVGAVWQAMTQLEAMGRANDRGPYAIPIYENDWIGSRGADKSARAIAVEAIFGEDSGYTAVSDPGADIADSVLMAQWWFDRELITLLADDDR